MDAPTMPAQKQDRQPGVEQEMHPRPDFTPKYPGVGKLRGKVALITGGDSGIGRAVAVAMAREGASIAITYLNEHNDANETRGLVKREGTDALLLPGDVGDETYCEAAVEATVEQFGRDEILVNNAGEQHETDDVRDIDAAQIERTFRTNVFSFFFMAKHALRHMPKGASIINTTSITAYQGHKTLLDYSATKGAIVTFTRSLSEALEKDGIRVNAVAPARSGRRSFRSRSSPSGWPSTAHRCRCSARASPTRLRPATSSSPARTPPISVGKCCIRMAAASLVPDGTDRRAHR
jgi:NAD(P)-dependent dehydrogenase (short-subunit alcohol dehydrogenase family)